jgi:hypothetical protein
MKYVRIYTEPVADDEDDDEDLPVSFDLLLGPDGKPVGKVHSYGLSGQPEEDGQCYPFALVPDGSIDFGAGHDEDERWWKTDLLQHKIEMGTTFKIQQGGQEFEYRIVKVDLLAE